LLASQEPFLLLPDIELPETGPVYSTPAAVNVILSAVILAFEIGAMTLPVFSVPDSF
jgi:hypothetical protein